MKVNLGTLALSGLVALSTVPAVAADDAPPTAAAGTDGEAVSNLPWIDDRLSLLN